MGKYWPKHTELPVEVTAADAMSSDESDDDPDNNGDPDTDNDSDNHVNASSATACSSPVGYDSNEDKNPDAAYARFCAQVAASHHSTFSGWQAELCSWNKSFSPKHTVDMDLCKYWAVCHFWSFFLNYLIRVF